FDEDVWAGLEEAQPPATGAMTGELRSPAAPPHTPPTETAPLPAARVEQRPPRAPFEQPVVEPLRPPREPFEPPVINPITPREQTALLGARPELPAQPDRQLPDEPTRASAERPSATESNLYHQSAKPEPTAPLYSDSAARHDRPAEIGASPQPDASAPAADQAWDTAAVASGGRARSASKPAGAVLGLPMAMSRAPLVLGTPVKSRE